jgi:septum formation protein
LLLLVNDYGDSMSAIFVNKDPLILASGSPRRQEMLAQLGLDFVVQVSHVDELVRSGEKPELFVKRIAKDKALAEHHSDAWILSADTAVVIDDQTLGKPANVDETITMLKSLAGRVHQVWTGFCLVNKRENVLVCHAVQTTVGFIDWQEDVFIAYAKTGDSLDKAGGYGIQGGGGILVREIAGSYSNVVGLPLAEVTLEMLRLGVVVPNSGGINSYVLTSG